MSRAPQPRPTPVLAHLRWYVATGGPHARDSDGGAAPDLHGGLGMSERVEIEILEQADGTWRLRVSADGRTLAHGADVASRDLAERQAVALRQHAGRDGSFVRAESPDGRFFFNLLGENRHVLATSERFASAGERDAAIEEIRRLAAVPVAAE